MRKHLYFMALAAAICLPATASGITPEDAATAQRVANALKSSGQLQNYEVGVHCEEGVAWLEGTVNSPGQARKAIDIALAVPGVDRVMNELTIAVEKRIPSNDQPSQVQPTSIQLPRQAATENRPMIRTQTGPQRGTPRPIQPASATVQPTGFGHAAQMRAAMAAPAGYMPTAGARQVNYDHANMPGYAWPSYAAHPNYAALTYPKQYSPSAWPYIGPFYPYPQVPLGWRKTTLEWDDGWWMLDFHE